MSYLHLWVVEKRVEIYDPFYKSTGEDVERDFVDKRVAYSDILEAVSAAVVSARAAVLSCIKKTRDIICGADVQYVDSGGKVEVHVQGYWKIAGSLDKKYPLESKFIVHEYDVSKN